MTTNIEMKEMSNFANIAENGALDSAEMSEDNILAKAVVANKTPGGFKHQVQIMQRDAADNQMRPV